MNIEPPTPNPLEALFGLGFIILVLLILGELAK